VHAIELLVIDDGSTDRSRDVARQHGVDHLVHLRAHRGLAGAFQAGLDACLKLGADVVVNMDADGQFSGADIPRLIEPVLLGEADMVIGDRGVGTVAHFSRVKRRLQRLGSAVVGRASSTRIPDATSGFRAYSREAAVCVQVLSRFTYTLETIVQAGRAGAALSSVPVPTAPSPRCSRLFPSVRTYMWRAVPALLRTYARQEPLRCFLRAAAACYLLAAVAWGHFAYLALFRDGSPGQVSSLGIGTVLVVVGTQIAAVGVLGDLLATGRVLDERLLQRVRVLELAVGVQPSHYEPGAQRIPEIGAAEDSRSENREFAVSSL
jgi:glycosyltransferase involved in cell wall biosynthesis